MQTKHTSLIRAEHSLPTLFEGRYDEWLYGDRERQLNYMHVNGQPKSGLMDSYGNFVVMNSEWLPDIE